MIPNLLLFYLLRMPSRNQSGKPMHVHQNPSRKQARSGKKYENTCKAWKKLLQREQIEWSTKWIINAKTIVLAKMQRMGIKL